MIRKLINEVLEREGGYVNHPADRGGPTKYGVTLNTLTAWSRLPTTAEDVANLTKKEAIIIYEDEYYLKPRVDQLPDQLKAFVFDSSVNHGPSRAIKFLQSSLNLLGAQPMLAVDGGIGPVTVRMSQIALDFFGADRVLKGLIEQRNAFYRTIVRNDPSQQVFLKGWLNRSNSFA